MAVHLTSLQSSYSIPAKNKASFNAWQRSCSLKVSSRWHRYSSLTIIQFPALLRVVIVRPTHETMRIAEKVNTAWHSSTRNKALAVRHTGLQVQATKYTKENHKMVRNWTQILWLHRLLVMVLRGYRSLNKSWSTHFNNLISTTFCNRFINFSL